MRLGTDNYYLLLGVNRFASQESLRRAYRSRILSVHPDRHPEDSLASERTRAIIEAYSVLSDPRRRNDYDRALAVPDTMSITRARPEVPFQFHQASKTILAAGLVAFVVCLVLVLILASAILSDREPAFRPFIVESTCPKAPAMEMPAVIEPSVAESAEWYGSRRYEMSYASAYATEEMVKAYSDAARRAADRRDLTRAHFYRAAIEHALGR